MNISKETRRTIIDYLITRDKPLSGELDLVEFLGRTWDLSSMPSTDGRFTTSASDIWKHMVMNDDWSLHYLLCTYLGLLESDDNQFAKFVVNCVHPTVQSDREQVEELCSFFNDALMPDGYVLRASSLLAGKPVYELVRGKREGVDGTVKNLIFAANGPKPEIVFRDAVNNDIQIVRNGEYCLVFDKPLPKQGLLWKDLLVWWREQPGNERLDPKTLENSLYRRLDASLIGSPPEQLLFRTYMRYFRKELGDSQPALVPQVYLHYDPYTIKQLADGKNRLPRQRMDFLLLFSNQIRIVVEIDGQQHYSRNERASPPLYAGMVAEDRKLRLAGYEIYRFGGYELQEPKGPAIVIEFFQVLFQRHSISRSSNSVGEG